MLEAKAAAGAEAPNFACNGAPPKLPVCIVLHQERSDPGHVGQWSRRNGYALDVRKPRYGDPLPATLQHHCGAVMFGGPMSANDRDDFIYQETWIDRYARYRMAPPSRGSSRRRY